MLARIGKGATELSHYSFPFRVHEHEAMLCCAYYMFVPNFDYSLSPFVPSDMRGSAAPHLSDFGHGICVHYCVWSMRCAAA